MPKFASCQPSDDFLPQGFNRISAYCSVKSKYVSTVLLPRTSSFVSASILLVAYLPNIYIRCNPSRGSHRAVTVAQAHSRQVQLGRSFTGRRGCRGQPEPQADSWLSGRRSPPAGLPAPGRVAARAPGVVSAEPGQACQAG